MLPLLGNNLLLPEAKAMALMQAMQLLVMVLIPHNRAWVLLLDLEAPPAHLDWLHPLDLVRFCSSLPVALRRHLLPQVTSHLRLLQELRMLSY